MDSKPPKLFISYCWSSPSHEEWVLSLATDLRENGVDAILDKWDLKEGHDAYAFMERMVTDAEIKKVALICDQVYTKKSDARRGGVGVEAQIVSPELYSKQSQDKFVAVLAERDPEGQPYLPAYYKGRIYIDLSSPDLFSEHFEQLLRWAFDKPLFEKPPVGTQPSYLSDSNSPSLMTSANYRRAIAAVREGRPFAAGALAEYLEQFVTNLESFRVTKNGGEPDEMILKNIEGFLPFRNQYIQMISTLSRHAGQLSFDEHLHRFFENMLPYYESKEGTPHWQTWQFDNYKFIVHELFLYTVAILLDSGWLSSIAHLLNQPYYISANAERGKDVVVSFAAIREPIESLQVRNQRLALQRISLRADLLEQRSKSSGVSFQRILQSDFVLFIRDCLDSIRNKGYQDWWPETLLYATRQHGPFEVFARAQSRSYFKKLSLVFGIESKNDFQPMLDAIEERKLRIPQWQFHSFNPYYLIGFEKLETSV